MNQKSVLLYAINSTFHWWKYIGKSLSIDFKIDVFTEHKTNVISSFKNRFYYFINKKDKVTSFSQAEIKNIYDRCRVIRSLPFDMAYNMIISYENVFSELFLSKKYDYIISFPIDRYPMDVLSRIAERFGVKYIEVTVSVFKNTSMLLQKGTIISLPYEINKSFTYEDSYNSLINTNYKPVYVQNITKFNKLKWLKIYLWQYARDIVFKLVMILENDPLSLHYLDSQMYLKHKAGINDIFVTRFVDENFREVMKNSPKDKNIIIALQLYPEASIDYWVENMQIVDYENFLLKLISLFSKNGYNVFLKDHPLQFGFRQTDLIRKAKKHKNVFFLPYHSDINEILDFVSISVTTTGTVGLQASLRGLVSLVTPSYYSNAEDFLVIDSIENLDDLLPLIQVKLNESVDIESRRKRIVKHLYDVSMDGDIFSFRQKRDFESNLLLKQLIDNLRVFIFKN